MSLLLPQNRTGTVHSVTPVSIHGDRYIDLLIALDDAEGPQVPGRVGRDECPEALAAGERVEVRFIMGVMVKVTREQI